MFKKIVLVALLSINSLTPMHAAGPASTVAETVKGSRNLSKWLGSIIPCICALVSAEVAIRCNKDNPDRKDIVVAGRLLRLVSLAIGCFFLDEWMSTDLKDWSLGQSKSCINS